MDRVMSELEVPWPPDPARWQEQVKEALRGIRATYRAHRDIARGGLARIPRGPNAIVGMERFLALIRASGLPDQVVAFGADLLPLYVTAVAYEESLWAARGDSEAEIVAFVLELRQYFESLPPDRFPTIVSLAAALTAGGEGDERFEFGLEVLVRGLEAMREG
jgi:hypothetical protein